MSTPRDVFVSYSQNDRRVAFDIVEFLEARGIAAWVAPRDVQPGAEWAEEIIDAIANARLMLLIFSASSNASPQVRREVERAINRGLPVLTFRLEDLVPTRSLEYFLSTQHWMDGFGPSGAADYAPLAGQISRILQRSADPTIEAIGTPRGAAEAVDTHLVRALEDDLLDYLGPIAGVLLRRALQSGLSGRPLVETLATEIDAADRRRDFLARHLPIRS